MISPLFVNTMMLWQKQNVKETKFTWHEFTAFVSRRTTSLRKFKGRGVLLGNQVKNQHWEAAFFQDLGNSLATFEASRWADFYGGIPGHNVKLADAIQAYIQARLTGPPCWVKLPEDAWPDDIDIRKFRRPVVRLVKALYGHPDADTMWAL